MKTNFEDCIENRIQRIREVFVPFANCVGICEELIYDVDNGITLCEKCHQMEHAAKQEAPHE